MNKNNIVKMTLNKKIELINKKYKYNIFLYETGNNIFPYEIKTKTSDNIILQCRLFENIEQLYYYLQGIMYVLEI